MDINWITIVACAVSSVVGALGGGGIWFIRETKRSKQLENESKVVEEWKEMYHEKEKKCSEKDAIITKKDEKIEQLRKRINDLLEERNIFMGKRELEIKDKEIEIHKLLMQIAELSWNECRVNGCADREPPRDRKKNTCSACGHTVAIEQE